MRRVVRGAWHLWAAVLIAGSVAGCVKPDRAVVVDLDPAAWAERAEVCYTNPDTISSRSLQLFLRVADRFAEDSLTVVVMTLSPDSLRTSEYHRLTFREEPTATPLQRVVMVPYRRAVRLTQRGTYRFLITPTRTVEGVEAVGLFIEKEQ